MCKIEIESNYQMAASTLLYKAAAGGRKAYVSLRNVLSSYSYEIKLCVTKQLMYSAHQAAKIMWWPRRVRPQSRGTKEKADAANAKADAAMPKAASAKQSRSGHNFILLQQSLIL